MNPVTSVVQVLAILPKAVLKMDSFEELGLSPELVEALAAEGIEQPTSIQKSVIPFVYRENNVIVAAGPGSGVTMSWAVALLNRFHDLQEGSPRVLVLTPSRDRANDLAESMSPIASHIGQTVGALGSQWVQPEQAILLFATPGDVLASCTTHELELEPVEAIVLDQASRIDEFDGLEEVELVLSYLASTTQRIVTSMPVTSAVADFCKRHLKRAISLPSADTSVADGPRRGTLRFRITTEPLEHEALKVVENILASGTPHALLYCRNDDRAADVGDYLTLHGYLAGAPGDTKVPVWLGVNPLEVRSAIGDHKHIPIISCDVPADVDDLDRRHGASDQGFVVVLPREIPHLRATARQAGYEVVPFPPEIRKSAGPIAALHDSIRGVIEKEDIAPYLFALESMFEEYDAAEVAAALALLSKRSVTTEVAPANTPTNVPAWAKLFVGIGTRDGLQPGDLLGTITGEANVSGDTVGRIEIKENYTLVEVHDSVAQDVIAALNGRTICGRAVRADFDRPQRGGGGHRLPRSKNS
ncbi:MAG TPA: DEAD/DEAH box helicase [Gemmatimonadetes bacterium]|jgi:ATP-dependent RNA helicase DeaD|nr:DEAD/DEAH box helicase [Gemmatimonadota bacterium]